MSSRKQAQPLRHGRIIAGAPGAMTATHLRKHLAELTAHANEVRDYGCHGTGFSSQGAMSLDGASGAEFPTLVGNPRRRNSLSRTGQRLLASSFYRSISVRRLARACRALMQETP
jgi:hypothetical protein